MFFPAEANTFPSITARSIACRFFVSPDIAAQLSNASALCKRSLFSASGGIGLNGAILCGTTASGGWENFLRPTQAAQCLSGRACLRNREPAPRRSAFRENRRLARAEREVDSAEMAEEEPAFAEATA